MSAEAAVPAAANSSRMPIRDAGTLILVDQSSGAPKVLMGRRHEAVRFMPGKFVFPGGRVEPSDGRVSVAGVYAAAVEQRLQTLVRRPSVTRARAYGLAAIRELAEETGILVGDRESGPFEAKSDDWRSFAEEGVFPSLEGLQLIARAITPTGRPRRFDARFFAADVSVVGARRDGVVSADSELVELVWVTLEDARALDLPNITRVVLGDLAERISHGLDRDAPAPFYPKGSAGSRVML